MLFLTLEGTDGTGKSLAHRGYYEETGDGPVFRRGAVARLQDALDVPVIPSREPGSIHPDWDWQRSMPAAAGLEDHLNTTTNLIAAARHMTKSRFVRRVLDAAEFVDRHGSFPESLFEALKTTDEAGQDGRSLWPDVYARERYEVVESFTPFTQAIARSPGLKERFRGYNARDVIRHALLYCTDSDELTPTAAGLLFFAGHVLHHRWMRELQMEGYEDAVVISDRAAWSNFAYGAARGDSPFVEKLYRHHRSEGLTPSPDGIVLLTAEMPEIRRRIGGRERSKNQGWDDEIEAAQDEYRRLAQEQMPKSSGPQVAVHDTTGLSKKETVQTVYDTLLPLTEPTARDI